MGILRPSSTSLVYAQEFSPWRSPDLWKSAVKIYLGGVVSGVLLVAYLLGSKDAKPSPEPQPTVTVTVYKAPTGRE